MLILQSYIMIYEWWAKPAFVENLNMQVDV